MKNGKKSSPFAVGKCDKDLPLHQDRRLRVHPIAAPSAGHNDAKRNEGIPLQWVTQMIRERAFISVGFDGDSFWRFVEFSFRAALVGKRFPGLLKHAKKRSLAVAAR